MTEITPADSHSTEIQELKRQNDLLQQTMTDVKQDMTSRLVFSELKAEALRAGIVDLDGLKLLDLSKAQMCDDKVVQGVPEMIESLKLRKPWLFQTASSSATKPAPPAQPASQKLATEMTDSEYRAARAHLLKQYRT